uniref:envelope membrane protein n=1 Tax=Desmodesmus abundans TaxID=77547 RepID=UPI0021CCE426|nr:envelope membrane protein [Desmodesmus abundans]UWJ89511.1 envelope membrane protein [Desmodesmus abundans]
MPAFSPFFDYHQKQKNVSAPLRGCGKNSFHSSFSYESKNAFLFFQQNHFFQFSEMTFIPRAQSEERDGISETQRNAWSKEQQGVQKQAQENFSFFFDKNKKNGNFSSKTSFQQKFSSKSGSKNSSYGTNRLSEPQKQQQVVSITYEEIGLFPRSFNRVFDRFFKQLFFDVENFVIQEYRFYRYLFLTTVKCLFILFFVPLSVNFLSKNYFIRPLTEYYWNTQNHEIFLNSYQQKRAFSEFKNFEEKIYFESFLFSDPSNSFSSQKDIQFEKENRKGVEGALIEGKASREGSQEKSSKVVRFTTEGEKSTVDSTAKWTFPPDFFFAPLHIHGVEGLGKALTQVDVDAEKKAGPWQKNAEDFLSTDFSKEKKETVMFETDQSLSFSTNFQNSLQKRLQTKIIEFAKHYNEESIEAVTNFFADILSFATLWFLLVRLEIQINITKSFLLEVFFGLDDSKKSLLLLFLTDLLVGYHSPNIWELFFQTLFDHYGLPESQTTIFLLVATLPVLLDVLFKYLIFRHLNRASPATVATYHAMIE